MFCFSKSFFIYFLQSYPLNSLQKPGLFNVSFLFLFVLGNLLGLDGKGLKNLSTGSSFKIL